MEDGEGRAIFGKRWVEGVCVISYVYFAYFALGQWGEGEGIEIIWVD